MTGEPQEIPGLAKYLPARPRKVEPGHCKDCGNKLDGYDPDLAAKGYWQSEYCDPCMDAWPEDPED